MINNKISTLLGTIIIIIFTITIGTFIWKYKINQIKEICVIQTYYTDNKKDTTPIDQLSEFLSKSQDDINTDNKKTSSWKTYHDTKYNYTIKYNPFWIYDFNNGTSFYVNTLPKLNEHYPGFGGIQSKIFDKGINGDIFVNITVENIGNKTLREWQSTGFYLYFEKLVLGDKLVLKSSSGISLNNLGTDHYYFINYKTGEGYIIKVDYKDHRSSIAETMISTLEFN